MILLLLSSLLTVGCSQQNENYQDDEVGYLTLDITAPKGTRAIPVGYDPKQLYVEIVNEAGTVVLSTDDATKWQGETLKLRHGKYTINAHSNNWDGGDSGRETPFYSGTTKVEIFVKTKTDAELVCTLANVKVTVQFDETVSEAFSSAMVEVFPAQEGVESQIFKMGTSSSLKPAYFPVGRLTARLTVINKVGESYTMDTPISDVRPRDHFIFKYSTKPVGQTGPFTVTADDAQKTFTYNFFVPLHASTQVKMGSADAWSTFAYLDGSVTLAEGEPVNEKAVFQFKKATEETWQNVAVEGESGSYSAKLTGLIPGTDYVARLSYEGDEETVTSTEVAFTTELALQMPNSNFDDWYTGKIGDFNCPYPTTKAYADEHGYSYWGTSNAGTALLNKAVTKEEKTDVHTAGGSAARLGSEYVVIKFAAASLFTGEFKSLVGTSGGKIQFGRPFTSRPTQLKGWFKYSTGAINRKGSRPSYVTIEDGEEDTWSCYVALMTESFEYDNSSVSKASSKKYDPAGTMPDFDTDERVIAYGELPKSECGAQADWKEFTVNLTYRDLKKKPSVIVLVISSSRYGDFFTGYDKSVLLIDDLNLVYGEPNK